MQNCDTYRLLSDEGRKEIPAFCKDNGIVYISPRVMKLKDFLTALLRNFLFHKATSTNLLIYKLVIL
mgnify:CR=1 FL=1